MNSYKAPTQIDLDPDKRIAEKIGKRLNKPTLQISAVTGTGIKELNEHLWQKIKEIKKETL